MQMNLAIKKETSALDKSERIKVRTENFKCLLWKIPCAHRYQHRYFRKESYRHYRTFRLWKVNFVALV